MKNFLHNVVSVLLFVCFALTVLDLPAGERKELELEWRRHLAKLTKDEFDATLVGDSVAGASNLVRKKLETQLTQAVEWVARSCDASDAQQKKLHLAGLGDIERFFDRMDVLWKELRQDAADPDEFDERVAGIRRVEGEMNAGLFGPDSLFEKAIRRTLNNEQWARYEQARLERRAAGYRARVVLVVAQWDKIVPLRAEQRRRLSDLLAAETHPPRWYGTYDFPAIMVQAARIPDGRYQAILDDEQLPLIRKLLTKSQVYEGMLQRIGVLEPNPADDHQPAAQ